jgi:hypothetical protein
MRNVIAFLVALGIVAAIFWFTRSKKDQPAPPVVATASGSSTTAVSSVPAKIDVSKVRKLDKETRRQLGEQIAAARERARTTTTTTNGEPALEAPLVLEDVGPSLQDKLREAIPILAACFPQDAQAATAMMTLLTDPELGTVIDTEAITGEDGAPLDATIDTCLRDTIDSLALPPLGPKGGQLPLKYTFTFD